MTWASLWWRVCLLARIELRHARAVWLVWRRSRRTFHVRIAPAAPVPMAVDTGHMRQSRGFLMTDTGARLVIGNCYISDSRYVPIVASRESTGT